ncbi:MAG: DUF1189 domain-containing protein [Rickettsiales bacterium]|nr:DUF1189 domain-containing protein [Rickettsiales bacterium]
MNKTYNSFFAIFASVYSADLYRDVATRWKGYALRYLFLLNILIVTPTAIVGTIMFDEAMFSRENDYPNMAETFLAEIARQVPKMEFRHSEMRVIDTERHLILVSVAGSIIPLAMIDHDASETDFTEEGPPLILSKKNLYIQKASGSIEIKSWESLGVTDRYFDSIVVADLGSYALQEFEKERPRFMVMAGIFIWCLALLLLFFWRVLLSLIYGVAAIGLSSMLSNRLDFITASRISAVAMTPAILIDIALALVVQDTMMWPLFAVITIGYITYAIRSLEPVDEPEQS